MSHSFSCIVDSKVSVGIIFIEIFNQLIFFNIKYFQYSNSNVKNFLRGLSFIEDFEILSFVKGTCFGGKWRGRMKKGKWRDKGNWN